MLHPKALAPGTAYQYNELFKALEAGAKSVYQDEPIDKRMYVGSLICSIMCLCADRYDLTQEQLEVGMATGVHMGRKYLKEINHD